MSSKTKIVVLRMKEIIYTAIFLGLGILLLTLGLIMLRPKKQETASAASYIPGIYSSSLSLGNQTLSLEVTVDSDEIKAISCISLNEAIETMYPLVSPAISSLTEQIIAKQSLEQLTYPDGSFYTSQAIVNCISQSLAKAAVR